MPQVTVYIRKSDLPTWEALEKKSEFIHNALATGDAYKRMTPTERVAVKDHIKQLPAAVAHVNERQSLLEETRAKLDAEIPEEAFGEFKHEIRGNEIWLTQIGGEDRKRGFLNPKTNEFVRYS